MIIKYSYFWQLDVIIIIIIIIIMKSSFNIDNNYYCHHYVIQRIAGFAITLYYHTSARRAFYRNCIGTFVTIK
jgi:hypothetical protein